MRENLIGYLIDALEPEDRQSIERSLDSSDTGNSLRSDLTIIRKAFEPLAIDREPLVSPPGLTARTMRFIAARPELLPGRCHLKALFESSQTVTSGSIECC